MAHREAWGWGMVLTGAAAQQRQLKCCNTLTVSQVKGITIGSLFQSSEASLTTPSKTISPDAHGSPIASPQSSLQVLYQGITTQALKSGHLVFSSLPCLSH